MARRIERTGRWGGNGWRIAGWSAAALLLLLPALADAPWTAFDYAFVAVLVGGVGLALELTVRISRNLAYRAAMLCALAAIFLILAANGAVGMIADEDSGWNLMFAGVLGVAAAGAALARLRPDGMARAMAAATVAQLLAGAVGAFVDPLGGIYSAMFAALWLMSAGLFRKAAREETSASSTRPRS